MDETKSWVKTVERLGVSTVYSAVAIFGMWRAAEWVGPRADEFMRKHFETMDKLTDTANEIEKTQKVGTEILEKLTDEGRVQNGITEDHKKLTYEMNSTLKEVHTDVKDIKKAIIK